MTGATAALSARVLPSGEGPILNRPYFDILFAVNRTTHPAEKRLLAQGSALPQVPATMEADISALLATAGQEPKRLPSRIKAVCDRLDDLLSELGSGARNDHAR